MADGIDPPTSRTRQAGSAQSLTAAIQEPEAGQKVYQLPTDPNAVVVSLQYGGGYPIPQQQDFVPTPMVRVTAAGKVITGGSSPRAPVVEWELSAAELQELLAKLLEQDRLLEIQPGEIDAAIKETGRQVMIADAPITTIAVRLAGREVKLEQYASRMIKNEYPEIVPLQRFVNAELRLLRLQGLAFLGGREELLAMLAAVNEAIGAKSAELPALEPECLEYVNRDSAGKILASWSKEFDSDSGRKRFTVRVEVARGGQRTIEVGDPYDVRR